MIARHQYMAYLKKEYADRNIQAEVLTSDKNHIAELISKKDCMTIALYQYKNMIFLYYEALTDVCSPLDMFPALTDFLENIPVKEEYIRWIPMHTVYYNAIPETIETWCRLEKKQRIGRIAYLMPDKLVSYLYYHKALLDEGLFEGERYLSIALYDTILFTYSESPRIITHLRLEEKEDSKIITEWRAKNPKSHFDHDFSGEGNFVDLTELLSLGWEEFLNE